MGWRPPSPARLCCVFSGKPWLTAKEYSENLTQVSNYHDVDFQCGAFSVSSILVWSQTIWGEVQK